MPVKEKIGFEHKGIGSVLSQTRLSVPVNQREYSWEDDHVTTLLEDFNHALSGPQPTYFLGTIVLTGGSEVPEVTDGQQRLATTTILLAAIYDYFWRLNDKPRTDSLREYLKTIDIDTGQVVPRLQLNVDDNEFFIKRILSEPDSNDRKIPATKESHARIGSAADKCRTYLEQVLNTHKESNRPQVLINWSKFIRDDAQVILLSVPDHLNAYEMFETLNDRGLRASQADLIKNYLLSKSGARIKEAQQRWAQMLGTLESLGEPDLAVTYLRHLMICQHGPTRERELLAKVKETVTSLPRAIEFLDDAAQGATVYSALFNPEHSFWNQFGDSGRGSARTMLELKVEQIRPLMLAVLRNFEPAETRKALRMFVSWSVRFLVVGGGRGGFLDKYYGLRAQQVTEGKIKTASALAKSMLEVVPSDATFEVAFREARVSQSFLARYYLRALERQVKGDPEPEYIPNEDQVINLEHIMPETLGPGWDIEPEAADAFFKRLGNMVLLKATKNVEVGNKPFSEKKQTLSDSGYMLTAEAGLKDAWGPNEIGARQARLAQLAVKTWPLKP